MKRTVYIVLALVLCVALLALLLLLIQPVGDIPGRGISYAEVSRDDPACTGNICLLEYMIVSNGYLFKKVIYPDDSRDIRLRFVSPESALDVIGDVKELHKPDTQFEEDRAQYHVYSFTDRFERSFLPLDDATARRMEQLSEELYEKSNPSDGLFIQFVFWRVGGPIKDYHIFGDGAIVYSEFDESTRILGSDVRRIDEDLLLEIKSMASQIPDSKAQSCGREGFIYGYLLVIHDGESALSYTCGAGGTPADKLFNLLLENAP